jgi:hypothetical protein
VATHWIKDGGGVTFRLAAYVISCNPRGCAGLAWLMMIETGAVRAYRLR